MIFLSSISVIKRNFCTEGNLWASITSDCRNPKTVKLLGFVNYQRLLETALKRVDLQAGAVAEHKISALGIPTQTLNF